MLRILMGAQYNLPLTETPFLHLAENLKMSEDDVIKDLRLYKAKGIIKRVGPQLNYRAFKKIRFAALVGADVSAEKLNETIKRINSERNVKHNFLREHNTYNLWFTIKAESKEELFEKTKSLMDSCGIGNYVVLPSKKVYKMDVKYDLYKGVSWSNKIDERDVERAEDLGLDSKLLMDMEKNFGIERRPFKRFADKYGYKESELVDLISELIKKRIVRDFYAVLNGQKAGFRENGMSMIKTEKAENVAKRLLSNFPEITHLVLREVDNRWNYPLYFMVHAVNREKISAIAERARNLKGVDEIKILYSIKSFKD